MRRISTSIAVVLSPLLLVSICSAQQTSSSDNKNTNSRRDASSIGIEGPVIGGDGTRNFIPLWISPNYLLSSAVYQASGGNIGIGTTTPVTKLDVNGGINTATTYQIGGSSVLSTSYDSSRHTYNLFVGQQAGEFNTGSDNTFFGFQAGGSNTTGSDNTFSGVDAGSLNTTGYGNTFVGSLAGWSNSLGSANTFVGQNAGLNNTIGYANTFIGDQAGLGNTTGIGNTYIGTDAGYLNTAGGGNIYLGAFVQPQDESNTIRIGVLGQQSATYIAGIYSTTVSGALVFVNSNGQLGTATSSLRFKEQVRDMGDSTSALMKLRPVTFLYKPEYDKGERTLQYGLIAEEVAKVYPELVANDNDGQPYTVRYQYITTMLLNEVQKQYHRAEAEAKVIATQEQRIDSQQQKIDEMQQRLSRLESLVPQTVAQRK